jgi:hypothetical protein
MLRGANLKTRCQFFPPHLRTEKLSSRDRVILRRLARAQPAPQGATSSRRKSDMEGARAIARRRTHGELGFAICSCASDLVGHVGPSACSAEGWPCRRFNPVI